MTKIHIRVKIASFNNHVNHKSSYQQKYKIFAFLPVIIKVKTICYFLILSFQMMTQNQKEEDP
jgi:hypothetical protein